MTTVVPMGGVQDALKSAAQVVEDVAPATVNGAQPNPATGVLLLAFGLVVAPLVLWLARKITGPKTTVPATWGLVHVAIVGAVFLAPQLALQVLTWLAPASESDVEPARASAAIATVLVSTTALFALTAALAWRCVSTTTTGTAAALGVSRANVARVIGAALVLYVLAFAVQGGLGILWAAVLRSAGMTETEQPLAKLMLDVPHEQRVFVVVLGVAIVPFFEEFLFRGFLQPALARHMRPAAAIVVTSVVFGALHGTEAFAPIVGLSCVLGYARVMTNGVWVPWVVHALNNGVAFALLWYAAEPGAA